MPQKMNVEQVIEDAAQKVLQGELDLNECLDEIKNDLGNGAAVYFLRLLLSDFLQENCDLSEEVSEAVSKAVVYDEKTGDAVVRALGGDERALDRIMKGIPEHLAREYLPQGCEILQRQFQDYLENQFHLDKKMAATISQKVVTEKSAVAVKKALNGDQASMDALLNDLSADLAVQMVRPKFKKFMTIDLGLSNKTADDLSIAFVNETNVADVRKALAGDKNAKKRVSEAVLIASVAQGLKSWFS